MSLRGNRVVHGGNTSNSDRNGNNYSQRPRHQGPQAGADTTASDEAGGNAITSVKGFASSVPGFGMFEDGA